jgi:hypothetical protein
LPIIPRSHIYAVPGYAPSIGHLVSMLTHVRARTVSAVEELTTAQLDHLYDSNSNSIGALLAHIAAIEFSCQICTFENRPLKTEDIAPWAAALTLGTLGREQLRGQSLDWYLTQLERVRGASLHGLRRQTDSWLEEIYAFERRPTNFHYLWFHLLEDEMSHCGQIRWLRSRLPSTISDRASR